MTDPRHSCGSTEFDVLRTMTMSRRYRVNPALERADSDESWIRSRLGYDIAEATCRGCGAELEAGSELLAEVIKTMHAGIEVDQRLA